MIGHFAMMCDANITIMASSKCTCFSAEDLRGAAKPSAGVPSGGKF